MSNGHAISIYKQLFAPGPKDEGLYRVLFTTPLLEGALLSTFQSNSDTLSSVSSAGNVKVFHDVFTQGVELMSDLMQYQQLATVSVDQDLGDQNGDMGVDIGEGIDIGDTAAEAPAAREARFDNIDGDLRIQLVCNIVAILRVWFNNITERTKADYKSHSVLKKHHDDVLTKLFRLPGGRLSEGDLSTLLVRVKWYLEQTIAKVQKAHEGDSIPELLVVKELLELVYEIMRLLLWLVKLFDRVKAGDNDMLVVKSLLLAFYKVDLSLCLDKLLTETSLRLSDKWRLSPVRVSFEMLMKLYVVVGSFLSIPTSFLLIDAVSMSSDIALETESPNCYENYFLGKRFDNFDGEISARLVPILAANLSYFHTLKPDLLVNQLKSTSFVNWITGNRFSDNLYLNYNVEATTALTNEELHHVPKNPYTAEVQKLLDAKITERVHGINPDDSEVLVLLFELLPVYLIINSYTRNPHFAACLATQKNVVSVKIEDVSPADTSVELLEVWLCLTSYIFQYHHKSVSNRVVARLALSTLSRLTSPQNSLCDALARYQINEFKWKLCHHRLPIIPINFGKEGFKLALLYILDVVQVLLRFNLTKKLSVENYRLAVTTVYQVVVYIKEHDVPIATYPWIELYRTLVNVIKFVDKQLVSSSEVSSLIEEIFLVIEEFLSIKFSTELQLGDNFEQTGKHIVKAVNYELVYELLLNWDSVHALFEREMMDASGFHNLTRCFAYLKEVVDAGGVLDHDLPELTQKISNFTPEASPQDTGHTYKDTLRYFNKPLHEVEEPISELTFIYNLKYT